MHTYTCACSMLVHVYIYHTCACPHTHMHTNTYTCAHNMLVHVHTYHTHACPHTHAYKFASTCLCTLSYLTLYDSMDCSPPGSSVHGIFLDKNTRVGCHLLLQGIFPTQGSNPGIPHCRWFLYDLIHLGSPICKHIHVYIHT